MSGVDGRDRMESICNQLGRAGKNVFRSEVVVILFFVAASTVMSGYYYGTGDHAVNIPFMKSYYDASLYPNDAMLSVKWHYYTFLWIILGFFTEVVGVQADFFFFGVYLLSKFLAFYAVYLIAELLFKKKAVSYLALFFMVVGKPSLYWGEMFDPILVNRVPVLPLLFLQYTFI